jgi:ABC-2 type transport system ATP-binding protein
MACALVGDPDLFFLDEPTTGLDPQSRRQLWELIGGFKAAGRTVVITTHYMDEAERLCDRVAIVDHGRVIALGSPRDLIASLGAEHVVEFALAEEQTIEDPALLALDGVLALQRENGVTRLRVAEIHRAVPALLEEVQHRGAHLAELRTHTATLEDLFVALTGRHLRDA